MLKLSTKSLAVSAMLALSLTAGANQAMAEESGIISKEVSSIDSNYCHIKYMAFSQQSLSSSTPVFEPSDVIDRYGSCDFNPNNVEEIRNQVATMNSMIHGDGGNEGAGN